VFSLEEDTGVRTNNYSSKTEDRWTTAAYGIITINKITAKLACDYMASILSPGRPVPGHRLPLLISVTDKQVTVPIMWRSQYILYTMKPHRLTGQAPASPAICTLQGPREHTSNEQKSEIPADD